MTDDDLHLTDRLHARADAVRVTPDLGDVQRRSVDQRRRRTRAAGAALAIAVVAGTLGGFALGRSTAADADKVVATGGGDEDTASSGSGSSTKGSNGSDDLQA